MAKKSSPSRKSVAGRFIRRVRLMVRSLAWRWRSSMQAKVVTTALVVGVVSVVALGAFLSDRIRDGLFSQRIDQIDQESAASTQQARETIKAATASNPEDAQLLLLDLAQQLQTSGSGSREVFLWREKGEPATIPDVSTDRPLGNLISTQMRERTLATTGQVWQSVAKPARPDTGGAKVPAVVVGSTVDVPILGRYELYYLYDLTDDQKTVSFLQSVLLAASVVLLALMVLIIAIVTRQAVQPVRGAARQAQRLADGHLDERLPVKGHDEMATLGRSFNEMATSLQDQIGRMEELSKLQRRFVSDVSHELRTPLTTVRMAGEVLYDDRKSFDPVTERTIELLQTQLDRFEMLLADLLEISRFDAGAAELDAERRDLRDVVGTVVDHSTPLAASKGVWLSVHCGPVPVTADLDVRRVERILRNLLANAIDHAEGKPVEITVGANDQAVAVVVRDYGVGLSEEEVKHVFDRFWRADPARARTTGGTGLGLAISLEDAHLHGGWLQAWGRPREGAAFRLTLPRRAGIRLVASPLPLAPEDSTRAAVATVDTADSLSPSALPDLHAVTTADFTEGS